MTKESRSDFMRRRSLELIKQGESATTIAYFFGVTQQSIYRWSRLEKKGVKCRSNPCTGRPKLLSQKDILTLRELLLQGSVANGWINEMWTTHRVRDMIYRHFDIKVSRTTAWRILRKSLKWSPQQPTTKLVARDEQQIERWQSQEFERIKAQAAYRNAYLVFVDEAGFMLMPTIRKTFAPVGQTPIVRVTDPHGRISTACAISFSPQRRHANLIFRLLPENTNFTGRTVTEFLEQITRRLRVPITIIWDSIPIHCAQTVRDFVKRNRHVVLEMLPKYAPELNPADGVWAYIKYARLANYTPRSTAELRLQVEGELSRIATRPDLLLGFVHKTPLRFNTNHRLLGPASKRRK